MNKRNFLIWMRLALAVVALVCGFNHGRALAQTVPTCNSFNASGVPIYSTLGFPDTTGTTLCTDYFGKANYANSPLPVGPVDVSATGFTILNGGSGYSAPTVTITDYYGTPGVIAASGCSATLFATGGVITGVTCTSGGNGYMAPVVTITDATGTGAIVLAKLASATSGGMRKFVSTDLLPDLKATLAIPDTTTFPGSDFYVIELVQYTQQLHADLPPTTIRGYCQFNGTCTPSYLGPTIVAQKNRPVRVLFKNMLPSVNGTPSGNLFIPTDLTYMGAGNNPDGLPYLQNRATLHLHGGNTPWISDGTPHQWTVPAPDWRTPSPTADPAADNLNRGVSTRMVPDMWFDSVGNVIASCAGQPTCAVPGATNDPGPGAMTFYWTNQQSGRLMFYHDHAYGITRLNVYAGEAAGYLLTDPAEETALAAATAPGTIVTDPNLISPANPFGIVSADLAHLIPLVIQDKTFVPNASQLAGEDPTWIWGTGAASGVNGNGDLWFPHIYTTNQNPADMGGANAFGRWDYGAWFFPPQTTLSAAGPGPLGPNTAITTPCTSAAFPGQLLQPTAVNNYLQGCPIIPNPSGTPEGFMDTPVVNGKAYPVLHVAPAAYRFRMLSAGNDRTLNLSLYLACSNGTFSAAATNCAVASLAGVADKEVPMVPATLGGLGTPGYTYPDQLDGRTGGVPDSTAAGPPWVQIGSEGGLLPNVAVIPPTPIGFDYNRRSITVLNVSSHGLLLGPAERADAIVDFSAYAGKTLIVYNDAAAPVPAFDSRIDYFTGDPDQVSTGGAPTTLPGYGPNTRTIMQIVVDGNAPNTTPFNLTSLQAALPGIFSASNSTTPKQAIVPEPTYPVASGGNSPIATYGRISDNTITFTPLGAAAPVTITYEQKAIQELFTLDYGRMNATLGTELPLTNFLLQTTLPFGYAEWATEIIKDSLNDPTVPPQLWKLTHNGVDTHFIHFHLFNVQVINRIGWDGAVKPPDANELGWKDTVRMNPLEDIVVALQPVSQQLPFPLPDSIRSLDPTMPDGVVDPIISGIDPATGNAIPGASGRINAKVNFGWEYVWHCHILGHEENDMMRPVIFQVPPPAPTNLAANNAAGPVTLTWTDNSASETAFIVQRDINSNFSAPTSFTVNSGNSTGFSTGGYGGLVTFTDTTAVSGTLYNYRVQAVDDFAPTSPLNAPFNTMPVYSTWSNVVNATMTLLTPTVTFTGAPASVAYGTSSIVTATTNASTIPTITGTANICSVGPVTGTAASATATVTMIAASGICTLTANWAADTTFAAASATQTTTATPALASVTPNPATKVYGTADPVPLTTGTLTGFLPADGVTATYSRTPGETVGTYTISATLSPTAVLANYTITYNTAPFTITKANATVTPNPATKVYGTADPVPLTTGTLTGFLPADNVTATYSRTPGETVGPYTISATLSPAGVLANYTITYNTAAFTITPLAASVTPNPAGKAYGAADPVPLTTGTLTGFLPADGVTATYTRVTGETVGPYTISATLSPAGVLGNYTITYNTALFTISKATSSTTITSNLPSPSNVGQIVTVNFSVAPQFTGTPTGNVTVTASTGEMCSGALSAGAGSCSFTFGTGGSRTLTAAYAGDINFLTSASPSVTQVVSGVSLSPSALSFGNQLVGTTSAGQTIILSNVGTTTVTGLANSITGTNAGDFTKSTTCGTSLAVGRSCTIIVRFRPTTAAAKSAAISVTYTGAPSPEIVPLSGTGIAPVASVSPTSLAFGTQTIRTTSALQAITLSNTGTAPLIISRISLGGANPGQFAQTNNCPIGGAGLAAGASCTVNVTFTPTSRGNKSAALNVRVSAPATNQSVSLTGTGQ